MKIENFQLRGNNSVCAGAFQLLRDRAPAQLEGNVEGGQTDPRKVTLCAFRTFFFVITKEVFKSPVIRTD
jgi:hypothetical protein